MVHQSDLQVGKRGRLLADNVVRIPVRHSFIAHPAHGTFISKGAVIMSDSGSTGQLIRYKKLRLAFSRFRKSKIDAQAGQTGVPIDQRQIDPEGNQRWHLESCRDPDVVGEKDGDIFCRKCQRSPNISKLIAKHNRQHTSGLTVPPDEPYGQYGLWWPRTIPYTKKPSSGDLNEPSGESGKLEPTKDSDKGASKPSDHTITRPETSL